MIRALRALSLAMVALAGVSSCRPYSADEDDAPDQPIAFYHSVHAGQNQMPCMYCHYTADRSPDAGIPSVALCVGCHVPGSNAPTADASQAVLAFPGPQRDSVGWCISCHRGEMEISPAEEQSVRQRSSFVRKIAALKAQGNDVRGQTATYPNQRASTDCTVCHY